MNVASPWRTFIFAGMCLFILCLTTCGFVMFPAGESSAAETVDTKNKKHLLIMIVPDLSFAEVQTLVQHLPPARQSELQLAGISMRTEGRLSLANHWFALSTGTPSTGPEYWLAYETNEQTSTFIPRIQMDLSELKRPWKKQDMKETGPGWLGEQLALQEVGRYVVGNSDVYSAHRLAPMLVMNRQGEAQGWIDEEVLSTDFTFPSGRKTDFGKLSTKLEHIWSTESVSLTAVELGDLRRIHTQEKTWKKQGGGDQQVKDDQGKFKKAKDHWLREWAVWLDETADQRDVSVWIVSPMVSEEARKQGELLAPIAVMGEDDSGFLTSETTKQAGIVSNVDLLPSIVHFFGLELPNEFIGKEMVVGKNHFQAAAFFKNMDYVFSIHNQRRTVITSYLLMIIFSLIGSTIYWFFYQNRVGARGVQILIGTILVSPVYFLWLTPLIQYIHIILWIMILLLTSFVTSLLLYTSLSHVLYLMALGLGTSAVIVYDIWQGSVWMKRSFLGYDPLIGARFYGLGNEYAGILLGSSLLGMTGLWVWLSERTKQEYSTDDMLAKEKGASLSATPIRKNQRLWINRRLWLIGLMSAWYGLIIFTVAAPQLGTNAGATLASAVTYILSLYFLFSLRFRPRHLFGVAGLLSLIFAGLAYLHLRGGEHTHIGAVLEWLTQGNWQSFQEIMVRKLEMNIRLIRVSLWGKLFATSLVVLTILSLRSKNKTSERGRLHMWGGGFRAMIVGAMLILMVNDSGIVSAAAVMIYLTFPYIYLRFIPHTYDHPSSSSLHSSR